MWRWRLALGALIATPIAGWALDGPFWFLAAPSGADPAVVAAPGLVESLADGHDNWRFHIAHNA
jgi:hypothetical protein